MKMPPSDWYKYWDLRIKEDSWVEQTTRQVDFIIEALELTGNERILDLACGYGRHSLELARRGFRVTGADITECYIEDGIKTAKSEGLNVELIRTDIRDIAFHEEFDVVLNLADGAIGYLENDSENLMIFQVIARALKHSGKSLIDICNQEHAVIHFPKKHWEIGTHGISLPAFEYDEKTKRMLYGGFSLKWGEAAMPPASVEAHSSTRLYSYGEVKEIFNELGVEVLKGYGQYDVNIPMSHKQMQLLIVSRKT